MQVQQGHKDKVQDILSEIMCNKWYFQKRDFTTWYRDLEVGGFLWGLSEKVCWWHRTWCSPISSCKFIRSLETRQRTFHSKHGLKSTNDQKDMKNKTFVCRPRWRAAASFLPDLWHLLHVRLVENSSPGILKSKGTTFSQQRHRMRRMMMIHRQMIMCDRY